MESYDHKKIEAKWQEEWVKNQIYKVDRDPTKPKCYVLDMFPYPSGEGLHVGHPRGYLASDVYSRMKAMQGFNVLHPMGWDAFGLPAENFAIKHKLHPRIAVEKNIARFKQQLSMMGPNYDWSREINTTDPAFYKWTQWIFLKMYERGLAYESNEPINWCPGCQTGLANEDVESDGVCERCGSKVEKKPMRQWVLKITEYADRMLSGLDQLTAWPTGVKEAQRNWIGRSEGAEIDFSLKAEGESIEYKIKVFTTRADTLFGATYLVLAPEHNLITSLKLLVTNWNEVEEYINKTKNKSELERQQSKEKTGVELEGVTAINPATNEEIPIWVAEYAIASYGTGALMAVPAHDERDFQFAKKYGLPVKYVIEPLDRNTGPGDDAYRPNIEEVERQNVVCIVEHPTEDKFLCAVWKQVNWHGFVTGGIEAGHTPEETARHEVIEETGYQNIASVRVFDESSHGLFYHVIKKHNRLAHYRIAHIKLLDLEQIETSEEEKAIADFVWIEGSKVHEFLTREDMRYPWRYFKNGGDTCITGLGILKNSAEFNGMKSEEAQKSITTHVKGKITSTYRIKDWVFSRQRYWGEPIPIIHCQTCGVVPVPEKDLPVLLPEVEHYEPTGTGESPLAGIEEWINVLCPHCGGPGKREANTMPQWAGSSWYYLRFIDPKNTKAIIDKGKEKNWMAPAHKGGVGGVDVYVGADHATRHLIYARFWHKFLYDIGVVTTEEPFPRLEFLGYILADNGRKMSKREGNIINPDDVIDRFGADAFRVYEMFIGPFENAVPWSTDGLVGTRRFIEKVWRLATKASDQKSEEQIIRVLHKTIKKVVEDIEAFKFNTAVSSMMIFINEVEKASHININEYKTFLQLLAPFAPHITEELWRELGETESIHLSSWPSYDESLIQDEMITLGVQINGKTRGAITVSPTATEEEVLQSAKMSSEIARYLTSEPKRVVYVPGKILNIVL